MPEGDTIAYAAKRMRPVLEGQVPDEIRTPQPRHRFDRWPERLQGRAISEIRTHGKHLFIVFGPPAPGPAARSASGLARSGRGRAVQLARDGRADTISSGSFEGDLIIHSHLRMTGHWGVYAPRAGQRPASLPGSPEWAGPASSGWQRPASLPGSPEWAGPASSGWKRPATSGWRRSPHRAWLVLTRAGHEVVQFDGPVLELLTGSRTRFDQRLAGLGPDILAGEFDAGRFLAALRADDHTRGIGEALLDQRNVAGIGNMWKSEGCWELGIDPWRPVSDISDQEALAIIEGLRPRMIQSAENGDQDSHRRVFRHNGRPCPRCGTRIRARGQGDDNRTTFWCPGCQR